MEPKATSPQPEALPNGSVGPERQLPYDAGKLERITQHTKGLVEDMRAWVDLKMQLTKLEIDEKIDEKMNQAIIGIIVGVIAFLALVFGLTALALGLGAWLGHAAWGFLLVAGVLVLVTGLLWALKPKMVAPSKSKKKDPAKQKNPAIPEKASS